MIVGNIPAHWELPDMARRMTLCQQYEAGESWQDNGLDAGPYLAAIHQGDDPLPRTCSRDDHVVRHGYGVGIGVGGWYFFDDIGPAAAFGRAARMSLECRGYGVYRAAHELMYCQTHRVDERVLHLTGDNVDREKDEIAHLKRFVQGVKEHPWSSSWHAPTGYITAYDNGRPIPTRRPSLPL